MAALTEQLADVRRTGRGAFVLIRGRRRVGKSWLAEQFVLEQRLPHVFFTAAQNRPDDDLERFAEELTRSSLPEAARSPGVTFRDWESALAAASSGADQAFPSVAIIDEFPYLGGGDEALELALESLVSAAWDRRLSRSPVMLIVIGSDLAMMERLTEYGRPLFDRPTRTLALSPLSLSDIAAITKLPPAQAIDTYAITGGLPAFADARRRSDDLETFLRGALASADTTFVTAAIRVLDAEFPPNLEARRVLSAIGYGERTRAGISRAVGVSVSNLTASLALLAEAKRVVRVARPYAAEPLNAPLYSVADPYLRFWLRFIERELPAIERQRTEHVVARIMSQWPAARGKLVEPIIREALERLLPDERLPGARYIGSYWNRKGDLEVDLVGGDAEREPQGIAFVGSIKWRDRKRFDSADTEELIRNSGRVPGVGPKTRLVAVSRTGVHPSARKLDASFSPADLIQDRRPAPEHRREPP